MKTDLLYSETQPTTLLSPYIRQYYFLKGDSHSYRQLLLADPYTKIIFMRKSKIDFHTKFSIYHKKDKENHIDQITETGNTYRVESSSVIIGPRMNYSVLCMEGELDIFVIEFTETGASVLLNEDMESFAEKCIPTSECRNSTIKNLRKITNETSDFQDWTNRINDYLSQGLITPNIKLRHVENISLISKITQNLDNYSSIADIAEHIGKSERQIRRIFKHYVGITPCEIHRLLRSKEAFLSILDPESETSLLEIAVQMGFSDESHFIKDFQKFCGHTPSALTEHCREVMWQGNVAFFASHNNTHNICKV